MSSLKVILILIIATNICCALKWSEQMSEFCKYNYFDFVRDAGPQIHFHRKCYHWTLGYADNTFNIQSFEHNCYLDYPKRPDHCADRTWCWESCLNDNQCVALRGTKWVWKYIDYTPGTVQQWHWNAIYGPRDVEIRGLFWLKHKNDLYMLVHTHTDNDYQRTQFVYHYNKGTSTLRSTKKEVNEFFFPCKQLEPKPPTHQCPTCPAPPPTQKPTTCKVCQQCKECELCRECKECPDDPKCEECEECPKPTECITAKPCPTCKPEICKSNSGLDYVIIGLYFGAGIVLALIAVFVIVIIAGSVGYGVYRIIDWFDNSEDVQPEQPEQPEESAPDV